MGMGPELGQKIRGILKPMSQPTQKVKCLICRSMVDDQKPRCTSVVNCNEHSWNPSI